MKGEKITIILIGVIIFILLSTIPSHRIVIIIGLFFDFVGGILLASEMSGLLEKIESYNSKFQEKIDSVGYAMLDKAFGIGLIYLLEIIFKIKMLSLKDRLILFRLGLSIIVLSYLESIGNKISTKRGVGLLGTVFLCVGFILQMIGNL